MYCSTTHLLQSFKNKTWNIRDKIFTLVTRDQLRCSRFVFLSVLFLSFAEVKESQHMETSHLAAWGHPVTVGIVQSDRCSCRPAQSRNKNISPLCRLINHQQSWNAEYVVETEILPKLDFAHWIFYASNTF